MRNVVLFSRKVAEAPEQPAGLKKRWSKCAGTLLVGVTVFICYGVEAEAVDPPSVLDPNLGVKTAVVGLNQPTSMAFLPTKDTLVNDILVLEKATGKVQRVLNGLIKGT